MSFRPDWAESTAAALVRQIRQTPLQEAQPDRNHVRTSERLQARGNPLRSKPKGLSLSNRTRCDRDPLVMSPEPQRLPVRKNYFRIVALPKLIFRRTSCQR